MKGTKSILIALSLIISACTHAEQREIHAKDIIKAINSGKSVEYVNKIIVDDVDFTTVDKFQMLSSTQIQKIINENIFFYDCIFMGNVTTVGTKDAFSVQTRFNQNLIFQKCDFRGETHFDNIVVMGTTNFSKTKFRKNASFNNACVWAKDSYFSEIEAEGSIDFINASFYGNLHFMDCNCNKTLSFQNATIDGKFATNGLQCLGTAEFDMISVRGRAIFNYATFSQNVSFIKSRFYDDADFVGTTFSASTNLENVYFFGNLNMGDKSYPCDRRIEEVIKNN